MGIRIGIVGVGFGSQVQIPGFISEGHEVIAVCARRNERAEAAAERFGIKGVYTDYEKMLKEPGLDAVSIVTGPALHQHMGLAALQAGKHVLLEKPFSLNVKEAWDLLSESRKRPKQTAMIGHEFRFTPARALIKEMIEQGYLGEVNTVLVSLMTGRPAPAAPPPFNPEGELDRGGGAHKALGSHYIDCLRDWLGDIDGIHGYLETHTPDRIDALSGLVRQTTADNAFGFTVTFQRGGRATMTASFGAMFGAGARAELYGTRGTITTSHPGGNPTTQDKVLAARPGDKGLVAVPIPMHLKAPDDERDHRLPAFRLMVRKFAEGVASGTSPEPNFLDGFRSQQVMDGLIESHRTGRYVRLSLDAA